jgi:hypothetical protein
MQTHVSEPELTHKLCFHSNILISHEAIPEGWILAPAQIQNYGSCSKTRTASMVRYFTTVLEKRQIKSLSRQAFTLGIKGRRR